MNLSKSPSFEHQSGTDSSTPDLNEIGIKEYRTAYWNLSLDAYLQEAVTRNEGVLSKHQALVVLSGERTSRSANDKFIVRESSSEDDISWGEYNIPYEEQDFDRLLTKMAVHIQDKDIFIQDGFAGSSPKHQIYVRVITTKAWQGLFSKNMFITDKLSNQPADFTVFAIPEFEGDPTNDHLNSKTFIIINFSRKMCLIGNTGYAGEIKKSVFTALNYYLPKNNILTMHCSANVGKEGDTALFFGLSGTGKTTLSADPKRKLIGDDEHGWDDEGIFNFEDGSYAKVIDLSAEAEPDIYAATRKKGTILENVILDPVSGEVDLFDDTITKNTRGSYPLSYIPYALPEKRGAHPSNVIFLTFDANGVMPPVSRLSHDQALYHFISGYTSKVGGTEAGVGEAPELTFSACFGAPFMVFHPAYYASLLKDNLKRYQVNTWLINTGLVGGPAGIGKRIKIHHTRSILTAVLNGDLNNVSYSIDPWFGFKIPESCPDVPNEILKPESAWGDKAAYKKSMQALVKRFQSNMGKYQEFTPQNVLLVGPTMNE